MVPFLLAKGTRVMKRLKLLLVLQGFAGLRNLAGLNMIFLMTLDIELFLYIQRQVILVLSFRVRMVWQREAPLDSTKTL
ncbi:hypothetical protein AUL39_00655 [Tractidigestivibacter scatoligenes]|uniref:Uncharacterized protein n=1 Tax=Tractidigestivibacter scatoligenes TaxID=1299998 RepID=A0A100YWC2_TRASO|nr:hypothetical protein AUL39_00655 [Tractidigestivibacter scatoligenes]